MKNLNADRKDRLHFKSTFKIQIVTRQARRQCNDIESIQKEITVYLEFFISENIFPKKSRIYTFPLKKGENVSVPLAYTLGRRVIIGGSPVMKIKKSKISGKLLSKSKHTLTV